ncbi:MAG: peptidoglycan editing factor PgeF [Alphaproteobacteria bacterium]|nr:peptidoglycan editing factor PgeF [Alphaproteobacteria bacterium]
MAELDFITHGFYDAHDSKTVMNPILMNQVHSVDAVFITDKQDNLSVDALITKTPGLNLTIKTADCAPVLLADPTTRMIAAIHAGWRGAFQGIIENTVLQMVRHGANLSTIRAGIGPHIQIQSFEIGPDIKALFPTTENHFFTEENGKIFFDFDAYVIHRLKRSGVSTIESIGDDTYSNPAYNSFRRDKTKIRQFSSIMIKGGSNGIRQ